MIYKVIGVDRDTAIEREEFYEAPFRQGALDQAFEDNIAVTSIDAVEEVKPKRKPVKPSTNPVDDLEHVSQKPNRLKPDFRDQLNQSGVIAVGIFFGLLAFSCISPFLFIFAMALIVAMGQQSPG
ncbi:hypothetical protein COB72_03385 [bacterium]|nr:MAG: hypothetical protein COB72_03385 [bacterium]